MEKLTLVVPLFADLVLFPFEFSKLPHLAHGVIIQIHSLTSDDEMKLMSCC